MYAKIFTQIFDSSIADNWKTRHVFEDLLKLCDINGVVDMTHESIAARTRLPLVMVQEAIAELELPDPRSRSHDHEGKRLLRIDTHREWGWQIVNYEKYRQIRDEEARRVYKRQWMANKRKKDGVDKAVHIKTTESTSGQCGPMQRERERERKKYKKKKGTKRPSIEEVRASCKKTGLSESDADWFWNKCEGSGWTNNGQPIASWPHVIAAWKGLGIFPSQKSGTHPKTKQFNSLGMETPSFQ